MANVFSTKRISTETHEIESTLVWNNPCALTEYYKKPFILTFVLISEVFFLSPSEFK